MSDYYYYCKFVHKVQQMQQTQYNDSVETTTKAHTNISALHPISVDMISILDKAGSSGNSSMLRPSGVSVPVLSNAPRTHS